MNLIVDIGNTFSKLSIFRGDEILKLSVIESNNFKLMIKEIQNDNLFQRSEKTILSTVKEIDTELITFLKNLNDNFTVFGADTEIPITNNYQTPKTLGKDRLAAVVAANNIYKDCNVLVFDAGTALTVDFIDRNGIYNGGCISPGIKMRFEALNYYTDKLPKLSIDNEFSCIYGSDTNKSVVAGVQNGVLNEVKGYISFYKENYDDLKIVFTGGDASFFEKRINTEIFSDPNLVLKGLNIILNYNA